MRQCDRGSTAGTRCTRIATLAPWAPVMSKFMRNSRWCSDHAPSGELVGACWCCGETDDRNGSGPAINTGLCDECGVAGCAEQEVGTPCQAAVTGLPFGVDRPEALTESFCACGRVVSKCDRSRAGCRGCAATPAGLPAGKGGR